MQVLFQSENNQRDIVDVAVKGTRNVLESVAKDKSVKRVVITSSTAGVPFSTLDIELVYCTINRYTAPMRC